MSTGDIRTNWHGLSAIEATVQCTDRAGSSAMIHITIVDQHGLHVGTVMVGMLDDRGHAYLVTKEQP